MNDEMLQHLDAHMATLPQIGAPLWEQVAEEMGINLMELLSGS